MKEYIVFVGGLHKRVDCVCIQEGDCYVCRRITQMRL